MSPTVLTSRWTGMVTLSMVLASLFVADASAQGRRFSNQRPAYVPNQMNRQPGPSAASQPAAAPANAASSHHSGPAHGRFAPLVPGTGTPVTEVGDDFEDPAWEYTFNLPKIYNHGESTLSKNLPAGISVNERWYEGPKRGQPDVIERVPTPEGGLAGSTGALLLRSFQTGGQYPTRQQQQDDFVNNFAGRIGKVDVSRSPSVVTRVYFPPVEQWERRNGCHFAFRLSLDTETPSYQSAGFGGKVTRIDESWPGIFVNLEVKNAQQSDGESSPYRVYTWMKADARGHQLQGPEITQTGWWTFGMSLTPDGYVHYYAKPGVDDLTEADLITSSLPYNQNAVRLRNFFFNVCNGDNQKDWSTPFIIDDPTLFVNE